MMKFGHIDENLTIRIFGYRRENILSSDYD